MPEVHSSSHVDHGLIDLPTVARLCMCSQRHVRRMVESGKMPQPVRLGTLVRWNRCELLAWIADGCPPPGHAAAGAHTQRELEEP